MQQLPLLNELYNRSLTSQEFSIITVAIDGPRTMPRLRRLINEHDVQFPVLHYIEGDRGGTFDWHVNRVSFDLLIDPQGVIVTNLLHKDTFPELLACLEDPSCAVPRIALDLSGEWHEDGSATATVVVSNPSHTPLSIRYAGEWRYQNPERAKEYVEWNGEDMVTRSVEFGEFGDYEFELDIPARDGVKRFYYWVAAIVPGTETLFGGEGLGCFQDYDVRIDENGRVRTI